MIQPSVAARCTVALGVGVAEHVPAVGAAMTIRHGRGTFTLAEYLGKHPSHVTPRRAEKMVDDVRRVLGIEWEAGVERVSGRGFHSLRRKWGKNRKDMPLVDVAAAGD